MDAVRHQGTAPVGTLLLRYSLPAIAGFLANALYQFVDRILVGRGVGTEAMAAVTCAYPLTILTMGVGLWLGTGTGNQVSTLLGQGDKEGAEKVLGQSVRLGLLGGGILALLLVLFARPVLQTAGASGAVLEMAIPYLRITAVGQVALIVVISMGNILRTQGRPGLGLAFMGVGNLANALLAWLAIFVLKLGVAGAALATTLTVTLNLAALLAFVQGPSSALRIRRRHLRRDPALARSILGLGAPMFLMQVLGMLTFLAANHGASGLDGARGVASVGVFNAVAILLIYGPLGIAQAFQPLVAYNRGAGRPDRVRALLGRTLLATTAMGTLAALAVALFPHGVAALFTRDDLALVDIVARGLPVYMVSVACFGIQGTASHYLLAIQKPREAGLLLLGRQLLSIPLFLVLPRHFGFPGLFAVAPLSDVPMALLAAWMLRREWRVLSAEALRSPSSLPAAAAGSSGPG